MAGDQSPALRGLAVKALAHSALANEGKLSLALVFKLELSTSVASSDGSLDLRLVAQFEGLDLVLQGSRSRERAPGERLAGAARLHKRLAAFQTEVLKNPSVVALFVRCAKKVPNAVVSGCAKGQVRLADVF